MSPKPYFSLPAGEANRIGTFKIRYVQSLLQLPQPQPLNPIFPQESKLLNIDYERRNLKNYDELLLALEVF